MNSHHSGSRHKLTNMPHSRSCNATGIYCQTARVTAIYSTKVSTWGNCDEPSSLATYITATCPPCRPGKHIGSQCPLSANLMLHCLYSKLCATRPRAQPLLGFVACARLSDFTRSGNCGKASAPANKHHPR